MHTTRPSLLCRLRQPGDQLAWQRFTELYTPLLYFWARGLGLQPDDASDLVQDVFTKLVTALPEFRYDSRKSFRGWLRTVTMNKWREDLRKKQRGEKPLPPDNPAFRDLPDVHQDDDLAQAEYRQLVLKRALQIMKTDFQPRTWQACWMSVIEERPAAEIAATLELPSVGAVYVAKNHVLTRLRQELQGMLD